VFNQDFYFQTIRKHVSLFGTIFADINISRTDTANTQTAYIKVPITYAAGEKMLTRVQEAVDADRGSASLTLPVMSFEMTSIVYDKDRKLKSTGRSAYFNSTTSSHLHYQYNPVPYNLGFQLNIWSKNTEDGTKIIEQILPYFTPAFTVTVELIQELGVTVEVPIILDNIEQRNDYASSFKTNQPIIWTINFTIKTNFWGPIKSAPVILFANNNLRVPEPGVSVEEAVGNSALIEWVSVYPGQDANGNPTSNSLITVPANTIFANSDFGYITEYSGLLGESNILIYTTDQTWTADDITIDVDETQPHNY
jgi:hypothetical protein